MQVFVQRRVVRLLVECYHEEGPRLGAGWLHGAPSASNRNAAVRSRLFSLVLCAACEDQIPRTHERFVADGHSISLI